MSFPRMHMEFSPHFPTTNHRRYSMESYVKPTIVTYTEEEILKLHEVCAISF
jgi:hypothetical protein